MWLLGLKICHFVNLTKVINNKPIKSIDVPLLEYGKYAAVMAFLEKNRTKGQVKVPVKNEVI